MNVSNNVLPEQEQLERLIDASETIVLKATFSLLAGCDHEEVRRELIEAHEALWSDMVREGNKDLLLPMIERMLNE